MFPLTQELMMYFELKGHHKKESDLWRMKKDFSLPLCICTAGWFLNEHEKL
jgi:hypothetical protein